MITEFERHLIELTVDFYNGKTDAYLDYLDDNAVWYGPRRGQVLVGKAAIAEHLQNLKIDPRLFIENITTRLVFCTNNNYLVIMNYRVCMRRGAGTVDVANQRMCVSGQKIRDRDGGILWRCPFIEVSNLTPEKRGGKLVPPVEDRYDESGDAFANDSSAKRLTFPGDNHNVLCLKENTIAYIEGGKGVRCFIHTGRETYTARLLLKDVAELLPEQFYRCHSSYIVNMRKVLFVSASDITLDDKKTVIPISRRNSREIREHIEGYLTGLK